MWSSSVGLLNCNCTPRCKLGSSSSGVLRPSPTPTTPKHLRITNRCCTYAANVEARDAVLLYPSRPFKCRLIPLPQDKELEECTFTPRVNNVSRRAARNRRQALGENHLTVDDRLFDESIRRYSNTTCILGKRHSFLQGKTVYALVPCAFLDLALSLLFAASNTPTNVRLELSLLLLFL